MTEHYATVRKLKRGGLRSAMRALTLSGLSVMTRYLHNNALRKPRIQFLYFHHTFSDELEKFEGFIQRLSIHHTFISYTEAVDLIIKGCIDKPYIVFSFDDGFKNNIWASRILSRYGISACFFLNPTSIDLSAPEQIAEFCRKKLHFPPVEFMTWRDVETLLKQGHEVGAHTMNHTNIAQMALSSVERDLEECYDILTSRCGSVSHFAFPYGRFKHFDKSAHKLVFKAGFKSCSSAERGCHISDRSMHPGDLLIRRDHVICDWPYSHVCFFLIRNARNARFENNLSPYA